MTVFENSKIHRLSGTVEARTSFWALAFHRKGPDQNQPLSVAPEEAGSPLCWEICLLQRSFYLPHP